MDRTAVRPLGLLLLLGASVASLTVPLQAQQPNTGRTQPTDQQIINAANNLANNTPRGGVIPTPSDVAHGMANMGFGQQTTLANNPNANLNGPRSTSQAQANAGQTDFGQTAMGVGAPIVNNANQTSAVYDELFTNAPGTTTRQQQQAQAQANQHTGPGYYTTDLGNPNAPPVWHPLPSEPVNYTAVDEYVANRPRPTRDPFAQPTNTNSNAANAANNGANAGRQPTSSEPFVYPPLPGPDYPTAAPRQHRPANNQANAADAAAIGAALGSAMGVGMSDAMQHAGESPEVGNEDFSAAGAEVGALIAAGLDAGCQTGNCGQQRNRYDLNQNQPMPMFTVRPNGPGGITDSNNMYMTSVAELLPIYEGYDPFASGRLVPWPGQIMYPSLYQPTGMSSAGLGGYSLADPFFTTPDTINRAYDILYPGQRFGFPLDPRLQTTSLTQLGGQWAGVPSAAGWMISRQTMPGWENWNLPWSTVFGDPNLTRRQQEILMTALSPTVSNLLFHYAGDDRLSQWSALVGNLAGLSESELLRLTSVSDLQSLRALLAQPFNVLLTWGPGAYDLDLHMTGPNSTGRFHIYYSARGSLVAEPFAELVKDCVCTGGSEVIVTSRLQQGGVYRVSVFNFGDQSASSTNLSRDSHAVISIVRGGTPVGVGQGTTIQGGRVLFSREVPGGNQQGNTWTAVEVNPGNGRIYDANTITQSAGSSGVH